VTTVEVAATTFAEPVRQHRSFLPLLTYKTINKYSDFFPLPYLFDFIWLWSIRHWVVVMYSPVILDILDIGHLYPPGPTRMWEWIQGPTPFQFLLSIYPTPFLAIPIIPIDNRAYTTIYPRSRSQIFARVMSSHHVVQFVAGTVPAAPGSPKRHSSSALPATADAVQAEVSKHDRVQVDRVTRDHSSRGYKQLKMLADFTCNAMEQIPKYTKYSNGGHIGGTTTSYSESLQLQRRQYQEMDRSSTQQIASLCFMVWKCYVQGTRLHTIADNSHTRRKVLDYRGACGRCICSADADAA